MLDKVISGGQTGIDRMGLEVARESGIKTGGMVPKGFMTEDGPDLTLKEFGLIESQSPNYDFRTLYNALDADATVIYGNVNSPGSRKTERICRAHGKPYIVNPTPQALVKFIMEHNVHVLNVAGNRRSKLTLGQLNLFTNNFKQTLNLLKEVSNP